MNTNQALQIQDCVRGALTNEMNFPQIVGRLIDAGVERYHADYSRSEITYYLASGDSIVVPSIHDAHPTGDEFCVADIAAAIRASQRGEHLYLDFIRKTMAAGCVGYFVQITGRRAIYFGRRGEMHVEHFPPAAS